MSKNQNSITWLRFEAAQKGSEDMATNRGFRMNDGQMVTYEQKKLGLSAYYDKRWVLPDICLEKSGIGRDNQQFFKDESPLWTIPPIVENGSSAFEIALSSV